MAHSFHDDLRLAHVLADNADSLSMASFGSADLTVTEKPDMTLVTNADHEVETAIRRMLKSSRTRDGILGEEEGEALGSTGESGRRWIIDPIDGTHNFVRGVPVWATLIALEVDGEIVASVVSAPALQRRWWASTGAGAFTGKSLMGARQIQVSKIAAIENASFAYSSLHGWEDIGRLDGFVELTRRCWRTRGYGDFWPHMMVAEGAVDIAAEPELSVWDMAALDIIVTEAGGSFTSLAGEAGPWGQNALSTNGRLQDAAMAFLSYFPDPQQPTSNVHPFPVRSPE